MILVFVLQMHFTSIILNIDLSALFHSLKIHLIINFHFNPITFQSNLNAYFKSCIIKEEADVLSRTSSAVSRKLLGIVLCLSLHRLFQRVVILTFYGFSKDPRKNRILWLMFYTLIVFWVKSLALATWFIEG